MVPDHTRGAHPTASGRLRTVVLFRQSYPALTNGGVDNAVVPCGTGALVTQSTLRNFEATLLQLGLDFHFEIFRRQEPSMAKNCCPSSSSSAGRLRQEPSTAKNCWPSSSSARRLRQESSIAESSHRVLESVIFATFASISFVKSWKSFL